VNRECSRLKIRDELLDRFTSNSKASQKIFFRKLLTEKIANVLQENTSFRIKKIIENSVCHCHEVLEAKLIGQFTLFSPPEKCQSSEVATFENR